MTLVILAAGMGSRYGGMKQIDPITENGSFIIDFSIYDAIRSGFNKVVFIIKEENLEDFKSTIGNRIQDHIKVEYAFQKLNDVPLGFNVPEGRIKPWGTAHALLSVKNIVDEPFAVINSDDFYGRESFEIIAHHLQNIPATNGKCQFCMAGYKLGNTVTENGAVNRGICNINSEGNLININEAKNIVLTDNGKAQYPYGDKMITLDLETPVSMNCWGFTPEIISCIQSEFAKFLSKSSNPLKDELYLTDVIDFMIKNDACDVTVYNTSAQWLGVTYQEDKPAVVAGIKKLINNGVYPENIWS